MAFGEANAFACRTRTSIAGIVSECEIRKKKVVRLSILYFYQVLHKKQFYTERRIDRIANQVEDCSQKICSRHVSPLNIEKQNRTSQHFVLS